MSGAKADSVLSLPAGMRNAAYIGKLEDFDNNPITNHYFTYPINYEGQKHLVFCRVRQTSRATKFYVHDVVPYDEINERSSTLRPTVADNRQVQTLRGTALYKAILTEFFRNGKSVDLPDAKNSSNSRFSNVTLISDNLLPKHFKIFQNFAKSFGTSVKFFSDTDQDFNGAFKNGVIYLNSNSKRPLTQIFSHELFHFLKAANPQLFNAIADAASISQAQLSYYLNQTQRSDVENINDVTEEIIADSMHEILKRVATKDKSLIQRFFSWLQDTFHKFKDFLQNPDGNITRGQYAKMADAFGKMAVKLKDSDGNKIFRFNRSTHKYFP